MATLRDFDQPDDARYRVTHETPDGTQTIECILLGHSQIDGDVLLDLPERFALVPDDRQPQVLVPAHRFIWLSRVTGVERA